MTETASAKGVKRNSKNYLMSKKKKNKLQLNMQFLAYRLI